MGLKLYLIDVMHAIDLITNGVFLLGFVWCLARIFEKDSRIICIEELKIALWFILFLVLWPSKAVMQSWLL